MTISFVFVGKTGFREIERQLDYYLEKLKRFVRVSVKIIKEEKILRSRTDRDIMKLEGKRILEAIKGDGTVIVWDRCGKMVSSEEYAKYIGKLELSGTGRVWMVTGGAVGLSDEVIGKADAVFSLSPMTFPHDLARLIIAEQTYRAYTILRRIPYHR